jgi:hypothetical protein
MPWQHISIARFGGPEVLELEKQPTIPVPGPGEVRIKVLAAGTGEMNKGCDFTEYGATPGSRADLVLNGGETVAEAIIAAALRTLVISHGRIVARDGALLPA